VIGHHHLGHAIAVHLLPVAPILLAVSGTVSPPKTRAGDVPPGRRRVGDVRQHFFVARRERDDEALEAIGPFAICQRNVPGAAVVNHAVGRNRVGGPENRAIGDVPIDVTGQEERRVGGVADHHRRPAPLGRVERVGN